MGKKVVLADTSFLHKLSDTGKDTATLERVLKELDFVPLVHPYVAEKELDMYPYFGGLTKAGVVRVARYEEFLLDEDDEEQYAAWFLDIHDEMRKSIEASGSKKKLDPLKLPDGQTVFTYRKAGMSLGDVHMVLMASFMGIPAILTEDSDIELLRSIAKRMLGSDTYTLQIYDAVGVIDQIAGMKDTSFTKAELENLLKRVGGRKHLSAMKQIWSDSHKE